MLIKPEAHGELIEMLTDIWDMNYYPSNINYIIQYVYDVFCLVKDAYYKQSGIGLDILSALIQYASEKNTHSDAVKTCLPGIIQKEPDQSFVRGLKNGMLSKKGPITRHRTKAEYDTIIKECFQL